MAGVDVNEIVRLGLYKDQELSSQDLNKIIDESEFGKLFNAALNFLSYRPRSEWEVRRKLKFKTKDERLIDNVVEKLKKIGQINDQEFAKWFVEQRQTFRPKGKRLIRLELRRVGVKENVESNISETELAKRALKKLHGEKSKEKVQRFLASRGFDWDVVSDILRSNT